MLSFAFSLELPKNHLVSSSWLEKNINNKNLVIIDTRKKEEFEKKKTTTTIFTPDESDFETETYNSEVIASLNDVIAAQYNEDIQIADTRTNPFYTGIKGRKDLARKGRIPTAKLTPIIRQAKKVNNYFNLPTKYDASKTLNNSGYGLELDKEAIFYCNTAHKARGMWFISKFIVGMDNVKVYEAYMVEFTRTTNKMETGQALD